MIKKKSELSNGNIVALPQLNKAHEPTEYRYLLEKTVLFPLDQEQDEEVCSHRSVQHGAGSPGQYNKQRKGNKSHIYKKGRKKTVICR